MTDTNDKICPLLVFAGSNPKCKGSQCAFSVPKHKSSVDKDGNIRFEKDGWYCLVRDFLLAMSARE